MKKLLIVLMLCGLTFGQAHAQENSEGNATAGLLILSTTTGLIALAGIGTYALVSKSNHASMYLRENADDIQEALASGEGAFMNDMATVFEVPTTQRARFAQALSAHYGELTALAAPEALTEARATAFFEAVRRIREGLKA